ncbi:twin transmembrane helix small protein [Azospirillum rugosum]|uniref:Flagellar basal body-associated protein FliL n=1 Tax=Azospirillum rugosum TaxID=416170 RepID=A0ABS4SJ50_9PROT|nr:twin transmembrane helix small protein [Azospirillum rugosum]MBP2292589.1 flagellar basal body-associated protein FliL [Azospirillum rugosum]MDQ0526387.1 flagellar basal body-associated protein FliL [Azospirillum rugosum]
MNGIVAILLILALGAVVASLFVGLFFMARGGQGDSRKSNKAMRLRVALQGVALVLFLIAILTQA